MLLELTWKKALAIITGVLISTNIGEADGEVSLVNGDLVALEKCVEVSKHIAKNRNTIDFVEPIGWSLEDGGVYLCRSAMKQSFHGFHLSQEFLIKYEPDGKYSYIEL